MSVELIKMTFLSEQGLIVLNGASIFRKKNKLTKRDHTQGKTSKQFTKTAKK